MPRYKIIVEYDGTNLVGWQRQETGPSVQQHLEEAVFKLSGQTVRLYAAGRTDAGVHATGQVAHFDLEKTFRVENIRDGLNFHMRSLPEPAPVAVVAAEVVDEEFHARFSATGRAYRYRIKDRRAHLVLEANRAWWVAKPLDADRMHEAAQGLVGHHDFTTFRAAECQAQSPMKTLDRLDVARVGDEVHVVAEARSFLHHQVRNMVGTLKLVGEGKWTAADLRRALEACDRAKGGQMAPPGGLYLTGVRYDRVE